MRHTTVFAFALALAAAHAAPLLADPAEIVAASAERGPQGWTVSVTLRHGDSGWDDYADGWRVVSDGGEVLGTRELLHPHVDEQPFTRRLSGLDLPEGRHVWVESSTNTTGWSGDRLRLPVSPSR
ncbi:hypothetical protein DLJ49_00560 [Rhodovulum sp. 12E13]|uniref:hypothetical protein n=1 Tax=Rhodovulum sp. 12E13 TaxID=2203891 RepID=UPI000E19D16F|nr:hypothetical protein [Rhodovulum sp. 12E13]RDC75280.1 hypothetical protein DLJ49_00560 [Rhodovulum sp. 12E13]